MIPLVLRLSQGVTWLRFSRRPKRPEVGPCSETSADPIDQPPGRILTTPVETDVEAGLMVMIPPGHTSPGFLRIRVCLEGARLILLEADSQIPLEAIIFPHREETTGREETGPGRRSIHSN